MTVAASPKQQRLLVVSHPCVLPVNQLVYEALKHRGWQIRLIVPSKWRHEFAPKIFRPAPLQTLEEVFMPLPILFKGEPQKHLYLRNINRVMTTWKPQVAFLEQEPFSLASAQWGHVCRRHKIPFGIQMAENIDRPIPLPGRLARKFTLREAAFVAARSDSAQSLAKRQGVRGRVAFVPHHFPLWSPGERKKRQIFTIGFAGRLVEEKGIRILVDAVRRIPASVELLIAGDGPLRPWLERAELGQGKLRLLTGLSHSDMMRAYYQMDVLVLPSLTTKRWTEQFGRVLVEAMSCNVPVIGSSSGEIPWVIKITGGGRVFPEGNSEALAAVLEEFRCDDKLRARLAAQGKERVHQIFSVTTVADALERLLRACLH